MSKSQNDNTIENILLSEGLVTKDQLKWAILEKRKTDKPIGQILISAGYLNPMALALALAKQFETPEKIKKGKIYSFISAKGGAGSTFLAINTAIGMIQAGCKVCLVDMNIMIPNIHLYMNILKPVSNIVKLVKECDLLNFEEIEASLNISEDGLRTLCGPPKITDFNTNPVERLKILFGTLQENFDYVILDLSAQINDVNIASMDCSNKIVMVLDSSFAAISNSMRYLELFKGLEYGDEKIFPLLNSFSSENLSEEHINKYLNNKIAHTISYEKKLIDDSLNSASPLIRRIDSGDIYNDLAVLVNKITDINHLTTRKVSGFWDKLTKFKNDIGSKIDTKQESSK